jgi:predicted Zn-dependent protease
LLAARIDPRGMVRFFERLAKEDKGLPAFLSTHPATHERLETLRSQVSGAEVDAIPLSLDWAAVKRSG